MHFVTFMIGASAASIDQFRKLFRRRAISPA
jgi:hypothetical protein